MASGPGEDRAFPEARFYRLAMESLPDTVFVAADDGSVRWICPNGAEVFAREPEAVVESETVGSLLSPEFAPPFGPGETRIDNRPVEITDADGTAHHLLVSTRRITLDGSPGADDGGAERPFRRGGGAASRDDAGSEGERDGGGARAGAWSGTVDPAGTLLYTCRDVTERVEETRAREESRSRFRALFEGTPDAVVLADDEGRVVDANSAACDLFGLPHDRLVGTSPAEFTPAEDEFESTWETLLSDETDRGEFELVRPDGDARVVEFTARADVRPGEHLSVLRDVTERAERERRLETQRDELAHLNHINRLVREVNRAIVGADTPDEVRGGVCRRLVAADVYQHALVATASVGDRFEVAAASGLDQETADDVLAELSGDLSTVRRRVTSVAAPTPRGLRSRVDADVFGCFPLAYEETVHGVLVIGADRSGETPVLVGEEQHVLDGLGRTVGKAITAVTARRLLHVDEVVTLEFAVGDDDDVFNELSRRLDATVTATALVPLSDGRHACYLTVGDDDDAADGDDREWTAEAVRSRVIEVGPVDDCRVIEAGERPRLEVRVGGGSPALALENQGTHVRTLSASGGRGRLVVETPTETNVRSLVSGLVADYPDTRLVRKLSERRSTARGGIGGRSAGNQPGPGTGSATGSGGGPESDADPAESLTEKQVAALRAAHAGGYYEWPRRGSSAQELAAALGVASSTFHQHLRAAERKLVDSYFDS
jgi:PAS domain S-box-containing protein